MSPSIKFSLLALVGAAAAVPQYPAHSKFHHKPSGGYAGPTGGWQGYNSTIAAPTGTGAAPGHGDESTTEMTSTSTIKSTLTQTVYVTPVPVGEAPSSVAAVDVGPSTDASVCGPATVTVTATNKVTVTVPAGGAASSSDVPAPHVPTPDDEASAPEAPTAEPSVPSYSASAPVVPSSSVAEEGEPTPAVPETTAKPTEETPVEPVPSSIKESSTYEKPTNEAPAQPGPSSSAAEEPTSASAIPSAKPTPPPSNSGGKRGLLYRWDGAADAKSMSSAGNFGWTCNWEADPKGDSGDLQFIPTLAKADPVRAAEWPKAVDEAVSAGTKVVFTFNEPDKAGQANLDVRAACKVWQEHVTPLISKHSDVDFVGPSVSSSASENEGLDWLQKFQSECPQASWKTANLHWYGTPADGFDAFKAYIEKAYSTLQKDFYVTEFGVNEATGEESAAFLEKAQAYLDANSNCLGYSYFAVGSWQPDYGMNADNLLGTAENLTPAGKVYIS